MSYKIQHSKAGKILKVQISGERNYDTVTAIAKDIMLACIQQRTSRVLVDVRHLEGHLNVLDIYKLADTFFPEIRDRSILNKCAILDRKEISHIRFFFEDVVVNRMFNIRIFSDSGEAVKWLKK